MALFPDYDPTKRWQPENDNFFGGAASAPATNPNTVQSGPRATPRASIAVGGFTPDYAALIKSDPGYQSYLAAGQQSVATAAAQRRAALQSLAIRYGGMPKGMRDQYGDIDAGTLELAGKNQFSDVAQLSRQHSQGVEAFKRALAARGALQSGDLGYGLDQAELGRGQAEYDLGNSFANASTGAVNEYVGVEGSVRQGEAGAINAAQASVFANPANRPVDAYDAPLLEGSVEQYGEPIYQGNDGNLYTLNGRLFTGGRSSGSSAPPPSTSTDSNTSTGSTTPDPSTDGDMIWTTDPITGNPIQVKRGTNTDLLGWY